MSLDLELYGLRLRREMLRRDVFDSRDAPGLEVRIAELQALEEAVQRKEMEVPPPHQQQEGVLIDSSTKGGGGQLLGARSTGVSVTVFQRLSHVPLGVVHLMEPEKQPLVSFTLKATQKREFARLRVTTYVEGYSARSVDTVEVGEDEEVTLCQLPTFFPERLRQVTEQTRATLHIEVEDLGGNGKDAHGFTELHRSFPLWLFPPTTATLAVRDPATKKRVDMSRYFGAWVTPNAQEVLRVVRRAADTLPNGILSYQVAADQVRIQVRALFEVLKAEGIVYVNSTLATGNTAERRLQRVRLPRESIISKSANCIDGAVLFASMLEASSLFAALVIIPGHAFVAWKPESTEDTTNDWCFLDTTLFGSGSFDSACAKGQAYVNGYPPAKVQLLPLRALRAEGIVPME